MKTSFPTFARLAKTIRQQSVLTYGLAAFALCGLFPPWISGSSRANAGYSFILSAPSHVARIDTTRLIVEWLSVGALTGVATLLMQKKSKTNSDQE